MAPPQTSWTNKQATVTGTDRRALAAKARVRRTPGARKLRLKELPVFSRMIAAMLDSGIPLVQALLALEEQTQSKGFRAVISGLRLRIEGGAEFSDALKEYPDVFDELYVSMMKAGEAGGLLAEIAGRIAKYLEASGRLRRKVKSAMMYPTVVMVLALTIATAMVIWLVPVFADIYADFGGKLPGPTLFLMAASNFLRGNALLMIGIVGGTIIAFNKWKKTESGAYLLDNIALRIPMIGELVTKIALGRFSSTFAQLIHSGVPILEALDIVSVAVGNKVFARLIRGAKTTVEGGEQLSVELSKHREFPRVLVHMLSAGEKTGKMDDMLQKVADFYEEEVESALAGLTSIIEPLLMVFLGVVVGGIVLGMFMPIFKMSDIISM